MLMSKPSNRITGRVKFYGFTPLGFKVSGYFARIAKRTFQIKAGGTWFKVDKIFSRIEGGSSV